MKKKENLRKSSYYILRTLLNHKEAPPYFFDIARHPHILNVNSLAM